MGVSQSKPNYIEEKTVIENGLELVTRDDPSLIGGKCVWPAGKVLAQCISDGEVDVVGKHVLELGCGLGLPSLAACKAGAASVQASDRKEMRDLVECNGKKNNSNVIFKEFDWCEPENAKLDLFDVVLAADVLYFEEQDPFLHALRFCLARNPKSVAVIAYRERTDFDRMFLNETLLPEFTVTRKVVKPNGVELYWLTI